MPEQVVPSSVELVRRATELIPLIESKADWSEQNRSQHDDVVEALAGSGLLDLRRPARYGGFETSTRTTVDVLSTLALGDGSAAWNAAVWTIGSWAAGVFPDEVQDEVFATPAVRVCLVLSPNGSGTPTDGGLTVNGAWKFMSGAQHSHWQVIITMAPAPDGSPWPVMALVPMADLKIVDDWFTSGLAGTGSVTTTAEDVFVPQARIIPMADVLQGNYASTLNAHAPVFTTPMIPTGAGGFIGVAVGLAKAARHQFFARLPDRTITYTSYQHQADAALTHLQTAEASLKLDESEFHAYRMADLLDEKGVTGEPWKLDERVRNRGWLGRVVQQATESIDILANASGGSSIYRTNPIQRIRRDMHAFALHALMQPTTNYELYGRGLCGLEQNTMYL